MKKSTKQYLIAAVLGLGLVLGVSTLQAAGTWTAPSTSPPGGNVSAPINAGLNSQSKAGQLFVNTDPTNPYTVGLSVFGQTILNGSLQIPTGAAAGKVLTSDASGNASWGAGGAGGGSCGMELSGTVTFATELTKAVTFTSQFSAIPIIKLYYDFGYSDPGVMADQPDDSSHPVSTAGGIVWSTNVATSGFTIRNPWGRSGHVDWIAFDGSTCSGSGGGGQSWVNVPLTDTSNFIQSCQYRFQLNTATWPYTAYSGNNPVFYATAVDPLAITYIAHSNAVSSIHHDTKGTYSLSDGSSIPMTKMEVSCPGSSSGGSAATSVITAMPSFTATGVNGGVGWGTITIANPLGVAPSFARLVMVNTVPECGYVPGDEVDVSTILTAGSNQTLEAEEPVFALATNSSSVKIVWNYNNYRAGFNVVIPSAATTCGNQGYNAIDQVDPEHWFLKVYLQK